ADNYKLSRLTIVIVNGRAFQRCAVVVMDRKREVGSAIGYLQFTIYFTIWRLGYLLLGYLEIYSITVCLYAPHAITPQILKS
ncbi:MAG: hypothetical protein J1F40_10070, partial [Prevotellaceae bacterium]|nr:hypothetical protein [Prevotellaceae bacterium]